MAACLSTNRIVLVGKMNLRDLNYFVVLADVLHFGEAAKRCFVSQPTLSMQIKKLEEEFGVPLFERNNKQVMLTDHGRVLVERARHLLVDVAEMKEIARAATDPFKGEIRLGVIPTLAPYLLPLVMPAIQTTFPELRVWLIEDQTHRLIQKLGAGQLDAAIMAVLPMPEMEEFANETLFDEPFYFACSKDYPMHNKKLMKINDLVNQPVMLLEDGHCFREQAMAVCKIAKADVQADFTATSLETLRLMVQTGAGVTLLPALAIEEHKGNLEFIPFTQPAPFRTVAMYWRSGTAKLVCLEAVTQVIATTIKQRFNWA